MTKCVASKIVLKGFVLILFNTQIILSQAQTISGQVIDNISKEPLASATIAFFQQGKVSSLISNKDGKFSFSSFVKSDSLKVTMIGYKPLLLRNVNLTGSPVLQLALEVQSKQMDEVVVKSLTATEIMEKAVARIATSQPTGSFETSGFYREVIKDYETYFSVAEAIYKVQFFPLKNDYKIQLTRGRSKEDVAYTPMFEDYHPGGGPQRTIENSFIIKVPAFLKKKEHNKFEFKKLKSTSYDNGLLYVIEFDQKPGVKEALEKGKVFIDGSDFSVVKFEAETSALGFPYIKHLTGTDKVLAELLNIEFKRKGWRRTVDFVKVGDKWLMNYVEMELKVGYKQPKKKLDLDLTIAIELLLNPEQNTIAKVIPKDEEWKSKDLVKNLPFAFDSTFWGTSNVIIPSQKIKDVIDAIAIKSSTNQNRSGIVGWNKFNEAFFVSYMNSDTLTIIPIAKCYWQDDKTGAMLYRKLKNDFSIEAKVVISQNSDKNSLPDIGHQQCGIIIRAINAGHESNITLTKGTGGNKNIKLHITNTKKGKSRPLIKDGDNWQYLKLEKKGSSIIVYAKKNGADEWSRLKEYEADGTEFEAGLIGFAHFTGNGPKMRPDIRGVFSEIKITDL